MRQEERESILREDAPRAQTARERRELANLEEDLCSSPMRGAPLPVRLRNFRPEADGYLVSLGGPRHYMVRLREIEQLTAEHEQALLAEREPQLLSKRADDAARRQLQGSCEADTCLDSRHEQIDELRHLAVDLLDAQTGASLHPDVGQKPAHQRQEDASDEQAHVEAAAGK